MGRSFRGIQSNGNERIIRELLRKRMRRSARGEKGADACDYLLSCRCICRFVTDRPWFLVSCDAGTMCVTKREAMFSRVSRAVQNTLELSVSRESYPFFLVNALTVANREYDTNRTPGDSTNLENREDNEQINLSRSSKTRGNSSAITNLLR